MKKWKLGGLIAALALVAAACNVVVTPLAPSGWFFTGDGFTNGSGYYVNGPAIPPAGRGSALLTVDGTGREAIASKAYAGISLSVFNQLKYSTYQTTPNATGGAPNLAFDVDFDKTDNSTAYQGRLVFVPDVNLQTSGVWQTWDTMGSVGGWYTSGTGTTQFGPIVNGSREANPPCTQASFCSWAQVMSQYPNARVLPSTGLTLLRVGGNNTPGAAAVDNLVIGAGSQAQFTNFEPADGATPVTAATSSTLGFTFFQDSGTGGAGSFVTGPNGADGSGSAQLSLSNSNDGEVLATNAFAGTQFNNLTFLSYKTYQKDPGSNAITLQFDADYDSTDTNTNFQGRVVFEPSLSQPVNPVATETWQTWNPMTAQSGWWQSGNAIVGGSNAGKACTQASPCSFQQLTTTYPNLQVRPVVGVLANPPGVPNAGGVYLKAGSGWAVPFTGNVDSLTIGVKAGATNGTVTYDLGG